MQSSIYFLPASIPQVPTLLLCSTSLSLCCYIYITSKMDLFDQFLLELDQISSLHLRTLTLTFLIIVLHFPGSFLPHFTNLLVSNVLDFGGATQSTLVQSWHPWVESWKSVPQIKYEVGFLFLYIFTYFLPCLGHTEESCFFTPQILDKHAVFPPHIWIYNREQ